MYTTASTYCEDGVRVAAASPAETAVETVVVGGGQAGLAAGYQLARREREFVVLDAAERPGESWRQRWDSLRLFTPAGYSHLPGLRFPAPSDAFPTKDEMAEYLARYAEHDQLPIEHRTRVDRLERDGAEFLLTAGRRRWRARAVIVATGAHAAPRIPAFADRLDPSIAQESSADYRNPRQLPPGPVLVVGAGNSGAEIALDLATAANPTRQRVLLAGRDVGYVPGVGFGNLVYPLTQLLGSWGARKVRERLSGGGDPLGRVRRDDLSEAGVIRLPRVAGAQDGTPVVSDGTPVEAAAVVWCTGMRPDFGWIHVPVFDDAGQLEHRGGITDDPRLCALGLPYQSTIASHLVGGVGRDAERIVEHLTRLPTLRRRGRGGYARRGALRRL